MWARHRHFVSLLSKVGSLKIALYFAPPHMQLWGFFALLLM